MGIFSTHPEEYTIMKLKTKYGKVPEIGDEEKIKGYTYVLIEISSFFKLGVSRYSLLWAEKKGWQRYQLQKSLGKNSNEDAI